MEADRRGGLFAACADASNDIIGILADRAARRRRSLGQSPGDGAAMEADRFDGLLAARADAGNDVVGVFADGVARRRRSSGKSLGDEIAMEADRFDSLLATRADAGDDVVGVFTNGAARRGRSLGQPMGDQSPWTRIRSAACSPLALMRAAISSEAPATAFALPPKSRQVDRRLSSPWKQIAAAACSPLALDAGDDVVRIFGDGAARRFGSVRELVGDQSPCTRIASTVCAPLALTRPTTSSA